MKQFALDGRPFDGGKFAERYQLDALAPEFWVVKDVLYYPDHLPDAPVLDAPEPLPELDVALTLLDVLISKGLIQRADLPDDLKEIADRKPRRPVADG